MIRRKELHRPAIYHADTVVRASTRHWYSQLDALFTDDDWARWAAPLEAAFSTETGRPADPVVYLKIFLIGYWENITYDTDLAEYLHDSLAVRAFLRYDLTEATPDHASISRVRARCADRVDIAAVLAAIVARCALADLVDGRRVAVDTTLLPANASLRSLVHQETGQPVQDYLREAKAADPQAKVTVSNDVFRSTTDPDARIRLKDGHPRDMYYSVTHVTDGRAQIILDARADVADGGEVEIVRPAVRTAAVRLHQLACRRGLLIGDTGFDDGDFHTEVARCGFTPLTNYKVDTGRKPAGFQQADFTYDAATNSYRCPQDHRLPYHCTDPKRGRDRYVSQATDCAACPQATQCLAPTATVRWLSRPLTTPIRDRVLARCHTRTGRAALKARKHIVEPPFGHLKTYGGLPLVNCRGRDRVHVKVTLAAVAWNLTRLVHHLRHAPRRTSGALRVLVGRLAGAFLAGWSGCFAQSRRALT
jgi:transposase